jgi:hypothetical protein
MSKSERITGSRVELFILKGWIQDFSHDYDYDPDGPPKGVDMPVLVAPVLEMHLADSLESVWDSEVFAVGDLPKDGEQRFFKVWFDLSTRKVLDVKSVKPETLDCVHDTYELEKPLDPDAIARVQACFDMPENTTAFDVLEIPVREGIAEFMLRRGSPPPLPNQDIYCTLSVPDDVDFFITPEVRESWKDWQDFWQEFRAKTATS